MGTFVRREADWLEVVESAYAAAPADTDWAERLVSTSRRVFVDPSFVGALAVEHVPDTWDLVPKLAVGPIRAPDAGQMFRDVRQAGPAFVKAFFYPPTMVTTHAQAESVLGGEQKAALEGFRNAVGCRDVLGLVVHPKPGTVGVLFAAASDRIALSRDDRRRLTQVAIHVEAGLRLRLRPEIVKAVIEPNGKVVHREEGAPTSEVLSTHARRLDSARTRKHRNEPGSLDVWTALVEGRMSLVERWEGSKRLYLVVENAPERQTIRAMTPAELDVVSEAARGLSAKLIAYSLGVSAPTVSVRLASAASKLGLASRTELVRIAAMLCQDPRASFQDGALTSAEREVLELLTAGLSNREIAAVRNRSARTIANQVARLLAKTGSATRRALAARA